MDADETVLETRGDPWYDEAASCETCARLFPTCMMNNQPRSIKLFCWILDVSESSFSISIDETQTVDDLKKGIVKEKSSMFAHIEADQLTLWKVSSSSSSKLN
jgi:hypothetical protein